MNNQGIIETSDANGEASAGLNLEELINEAQYLGRKALEVIPCQVRGIAISTLKGVEIRQMTSETNNSAHERPIPLKVVGGNDMIQSSGKPERGDKEPHNT